MAKILSHTVKLSPYVEFKSTGRWNTHLQSWSVMFPVQDGQASGVLYHCWCYSWTEIFVIPIVIIFIACHCSAKYWELFQGCEPVPFQACSLPLKQNFNCQSCIVLKLQSLKDENRFLLVALQAMFSFMWVTKNRTATWCLLT